MKKILENGWKIWAIMLIVSLLDLWTLPGTKHFSGGFVAMFLFGTFLMIRGFVLWNKIGKK